MEGRMTDISKDALGAMGFKEHPSDEILEAIFHLIKVYSIQGFEFNDLEEIKQTQSIRFGQICTAIIGNSVNAISNTLFKEDIVENEEEWQKESKASPPFLFLCFGPMELHQLKGGFRQKENDEILTYDCFSSAKKQLISWENEFLSSVMTSISVKFSSSKKLVNFIPVSRSFFWKNYQR